MQMQYSTVVKSGYGYRGPENPVLSSKIIIFRYTSIFYALKVPLKLNSNISITRESIENALLSKDWVLF